MSGLTSDYPFSGVGYADDGGSTEYNEVDGDDILYKVQQFYPEVEVFDGSILRWCDALTRDLKVFPDPDW